MGGLAYILLQAIMVCMYIYLQWMMAHKPTARSALLCLVMTTPHLSLPRHDLPNHWVTIHSMRIKKELLSPLSNLSYPLPSKVKTTKSPGICYTSRERRMTGGRRKRRI